MHRRIISLFAAVGVLVGGALPAFAAGEGKIQVSPQDGGMLISGGEVTLYPVGEAVQGGYRLSAGVADWIVEQGSIYAPEIAMWLAHNTEVDGTVKDSTGSATFEDLDAGVYLLVQNEPAPHYDPFEPFIVVLPLDGPKWEAPIFPKVNRLQGENPKTADAERLLPAVTGMFVSALGLAACFCMRKKRRAE